MYKGKTHIHKWKVNHTHPAKNGEKFIFCACSNCNLQLLIKVEWMEETKQHRVAFIIGGMDNQQRVYKKTIYPVYVPAFCYQGDIPDSFMLYGKPLKQMIRRAE